MAHLSVASSANTSSRLKVLTSVSIVSEAIRIPDKLMDFVELILDPETETRLIEQKRVPGENNVGMVAWRLTLYTPEFPDGRDIIVIANDITYLIGSFGPREDKVGIPL